ncbi:hypothetical protein AAMO2058_001300700 [Amorphochlora amoebiformis]
MRVTGAGLVVALTLSLAAPGLRRRRTTYSRERRTAQAGVFQRLRGGVVIPRELVSPSDSLSDDYYDQRWQSYYPAVRRIWSQVLGISEATANKFLPHDDFYKVGGNPLMLTQVAYLLGMGINQANNNRTLARHTRIYGINQIREEQELEEQRQLREYKRKFDNPSKVVLDWPDYLLPLRYGSLLTLVNQNDDKEEESGVNDLLKKAIAAKSEGESRLQNLSSNIPEKYQSQGVLLSALESMGSKQLERKQQNAFNEMYPMLQRDIVERDLRSARYAEANLRFDSLGGIAVDGDGNIYVTDGDAHQVKKITKDKDGLYVVLATGTGRAQLADGSASCAMFDTPNDLTITPSGNIVIADAGNNCIRQLYRNGTVTTLAGSSHRGQRDGRGTRADFWYPTSVACDAKGRIFVADSRNCKIRIIQTDGEVTTFAGTGQFGNQDGYRLQASFKNPFDITADAKGTTIYVAQSIIG